MPKDKAHYVPLEQVEASYKKHGIILTCEVSSACGLPAYLLNVNWDRVDCKRCLKKRPEAQSPASREDSKP